MYLNRIKITLILVSVLFGSKLIAQDTVRLDSTSFYQVSGTALGKTIVYAQRNVQLEKEGNYHGTTKEREVRFTLNKNFYVDGAFSSKNQKKGISIVAIYHDGTEMFNQWTNGNLVLTRKVTVEKQGKNYLIVKTKVNKQDSTVEHYLNDKPLLKEKYSGGVLVIKNDRKTQEAFIYGKDGKLWEKHDKNGEEKYDYDGTVSFKKIYLKGRTEEYKYGKLVKLFEFQKDKSGRDLYTTTTFDKDGNVINKISDTTPTATIAPEYMIFDLPSGEFEAYKEVANRKH